MMENARIAEKVVPIITLVLIVPDESDFGVS